MKVNIRLKYFTCALMICLIPAVLCAYRFDIVTVGDIVEKVQKKFEALESYQAAFSISIEKMGKKRIQKGLIRYKADDKLNIEFYSPQGQKIISNGNMLWIYIPSMNVVAEQDLKSSSSLFPSNTKTGLQRLFSKYHYRFDSSEQPEGNKNGEKFYTLFLKQKESRSGYRTLKLWISEDFFITRASGVTSSGKKVDINFSSIKTNISLSNALFKFDIPSRARVIKNPMIAEE